MRIFPNHDQQKSTFILVSTINFIHKSQLMFFILYFIFDRIIGSRLSSHFQLRVRPWFTPFSKLYIKSMLNARCRVLWIIWIKCNSDYLLPFNNTGDSFELRVLKLTSFLMSYVVCNTLRLIQQLLCGLKPLNLPGFWYISKRTNKLKMSKLLCSTGGVDVKQFLTWPMLRHWIRKTGSNVW